MSRRSSSHSAPAPTSRARARDGLREHYDGLWSGAIERIRTGGAESDPVLRDGAPDRRRGLTLIARSSLAVRKNVLDFLKELKRLEPEQYYYTASELHITVLSLFTATAEYEPFFAKREAYISAVDAAIREVPPISIDFEGITASVGTVMVQGFFEDETLNTVRDRLRSELRKRGLGAGLDQRYRLRTAHMTVARFRSPLSNSRRFASELVHARHRPFGRTAVGSFILVENDWYMSHRATRILKRYRLGQ